MPWYNVFEESSHQHVSETSTETTGSIELPREPLLTYASSSSRNNRGSSQDEDDTRGNTPTTAGFFLPDRHISPEIWHEILVFLPGTHVRRLACVSRTFYRLTMSPVLWSRLLQAHHEVDPNRDALIRVFRLRRISRGRVHSIQDSETRTRSVIASGYDNPHGDIHAGARSPDDADDESIANAEVYMWAYWTKERATERKKKWNEEVHEARQRIRQRNIDNLVSERRSLIPCTAVRCLADFHQFLCIPFGIGISGFLTIMLSGICKGSCNWWALLLPFFIASTLILTGSCQILVCCLFMDGHRNSTIRMAHWNSESYSLCGLFYNELNIAQSWCCAKCAGICISFSCFIWTGLCSSLKLTGYLPTVPWTFCMGPTPVGLLLSSFWVFTVTKRLQADLRYFVRISFVSLFASVASGLIIYSLRMDDPLHEQKLECFCGGLFISAKAISSCRSSAYNRLELRMNNIRGALLCTSLLLLALWQGLNGIFLEDQKSNIFFFWLPSLIFFAAIGFALQVISFLQCYKRFKDDNVFANGCCRYLSRTTHVYRRFHEIPEELERYNQN